MKKLLLILSIFVTVAIPLQATEALEDTQKPQERLAYEGNYEHWIKWFNEEVSLYNTHIEKLKELNKTAEENLKKAKAATTRHQFIKGSSLLSGNSDLLTPEQRAQIASFTEDTAKDGLEASQEIETLATEISELLQTIAQQQQLLKEGIAYVRKNEPIWVKFAGQNKRKLADLNEFLEKNAEAMELAAKNAKSAGLEQGASLKEIVSESRLIAKELKEESPGIIAHY